MQVFKKKVQALFGIIIQDFHLTCSPVWKIEFLSGQFSRLNRLACQELVHPLTKAKLFASLACHIIYFTNLPTEFTTWHRMLCSNFRLWCLTKERVRAFGHPFHITCICEVVIAKKNGHIPFENQQQKLHWFQLQKSWALSKRETFKIIFFNLWRLTFCHNFYLLQSSGAVILKHLPNLQKGLKMYKILHLLKYAAAWGVIPWGFSTCLKERKKVLLWKPANHLTLSFLSEGGVTLFTL